MNIANKYSILLFYRFSGIIITIIVFITLYYGLQVGL